MQLQRRGGGPGPVFELASADPAGALLLLGTARPAAPHPQSEHKAPAQHHGALPAAQRPPRTQLVTPSHDAARLERGLHAIQPPAAPFTSSGSSSSAADAPAAAAQGWGQQLRGLALRVGDMTQPSGEAPGDASWGERTANVLTSLPFLALGWHMHRWVLHVAGGRGCSGPPLADADAAAPLGRRAARRYARPCTHLLLLHSPDSCSL